MKNIFVTVEQTKNNYGACIDILPGCVATHKTFEGLVRYMHEAVEFHLEGTREDGDYVHPDFDGEYQLVFQFVDMPKPIKAKAQKRKLELA
jgi:predicted RNase H-like HicB family nuclease